MSVACNEQDEGDKMRWRSFEDKLDIEESFSASDCLRAFDFEVYIRLVAVDI